VKGAEVKASKPLKLYLKLRMLSRFKYSVGKIPIIIERTKRKKLISEMAQ
jgi:hypothetical protein